ncbi:unnamed protein product [Rhizophagus irregularis]|nr:unnamed protein product [Rhizophagus irregularis]
MYFNRNISSYYWDIASSIYKEVGYNKVKAPMMLMNRFEVFQLGYYGFNGLYTIVNTLIDLFVNSNNLTKGSNVLIRPYGFYLRSYNTRSNITSDLRGP